MVCGAGFTLASSYILRTILKSETCILPFNCTTVFYCFNCIRILMACIRNRGLCLCPRCTTPLPMVHLVGTKRDRKARTSLARVDDCQHRRIVSTARNFIYQRNYGVDSKAVERLLKPLSLVPTSVRIWLLQELRSLILSILGRMPFLNDSPSLVLISSQYFWSTSCTRSNWVYGEPCLFIFSGS
jgi:hypothetical protein